MVSEFLERFSGWDEEELTDEVRAILHEDPDTARSDLELEINAPDVLAGAQQSVLEDARIVGHTVLSPIVAGNSNPVEALLHQLKGSVGRSAGDSAVSGKVTTKFLLQEAERSVFNGEIDVIDDFHCLRNAEKSAVVGDIVRSSHDEVHSILGKAENSVIKGTILSTNWGDVLQRAQQSAVEGDIRADTVLERAEGSAVKGDIEANTVLRQAKDSLVYGSIDTEILLKEAQRSVVVGDTVQAERIGDEPVTEACLIVAEDIEVSDYVAYDLNIISSSEASIMYNSATYNGDWEELQEVVVDRWLDGGFAFLELFDSFVDSTEVYEDAEEVEEELQRLQEMYEDVEEELESYRGWNDVFGPSLEFPSLDGMEAEEKVAYLKDITDNVREHIQDSLGLSDEATDALLDSNIDSFILRHWEKYEESWVVPNVPAFIETHATMPEGRVVNPEFHETYHINPANGDITQDMEGLEGDAYEEGKQLLEELRGGHRKFDMDAPSGSRMEHKVEKLCEKINVLSEKIDTAYQEDRDEEEIEHLLERKERRKEELEEYRYKCLDEFFDRLAVDLEEPLKDDVVHALNQAKQHVLVEGSRTWQEARRYENAIHLEAEENLGDTLEIYTWDKTLEEVPKVHHYQACVFPEREETDWIRYMQDRHTQLIKIDAGEHRGIAIGVEAEPEDGDGEYFVVNGVESASNIFKRKEVVEATVEGLEEWAHEAGYAGIVYNKTPRNTAPKQFRNNLAELEDYEALSCEMEKKGPEVEHEIDFPEFTGYVKEF